MAQHHPRRDRGRFAFPGWVHATDEGSGGSFAASGRDAGLKTGAPSLLGQLPGHMTLSIGSYNPGTPPWAFSIATFSG